MYRVSVLQLCQNVGELFQGGLQVAKVVRFHAARNASFADPDVQNELRIIGLEQVIGELRQQALARAAARTEVAVRQAR